MKRILLAGALSLAVAGCLPVVPFPIIAASSGVSGLSWLTTGKTTTDHVISSTMAEDCALHRAILGGEVCRPHGPEGSPIAYTVEFRDEYADGPLYDDRLPAGRPAAETASAPADRAGPAALPLPPVVEIAALDTAPPAPPARPAPLPPAVERAALPRIAAGTAPRPAGPAPLPQLAEVSAPLSVGRVPLPRLGAEAGAALDPLSAERPPLPRPRSGPEAASAPLSVERVPLPRLFQARIAAIPSPRPTS